MPDLQPPLRDVREEPSFTAAAKAIEPDAERFDEMASAITWRIARNAESHPPIPGTPFRLARARTMTGLLRVLFTINPDGCVCSLWHVDHVEQTDDPSFDSTEQEDAPE